MTDKGNAHVRADSTTRSTPEVVASDRERLMNDPVFIAVIDEARDGIVHMLERFIHPGTAEGDDYDLEMVKRLRALNTVKRIVSVSVDRQKQTYALEQQRLLLAEDELDE